MEIVAFVLIVAAVACAVCDVRTRRIPNAITLPGIGLVVACGVVVPSMLLAGAVCGVVYAAAFAMRACGGGDVKLAVVVGGALETPSLALVAVVVAAVATAAACAVTRRRAMVHGPAMAGAAAIVFGVSAVM